MNYCIWSNFRGPPKHDSYMRYTCYNRDQNHFLFQFIRNELRYHQIFWRALTLLKLFWNAFTHIIPSFNSTAQLEKFEFQVQPF